MPNFQTRLPLSTLSTATVTYDETADTTQLQLGFDDDGSTHLTMAGNEVDYLTIIANSLLNYTEEVRKCHS